MTDLATRPAAAADTIRALAESVGELGAQVVAAKAFRERL